MNKIFALLFASLFLRACDDKVKFDTPQPTLENNLTKIPKRLRGTYVAISDSTRLVIDEKRVIKWDRLSGKEPADSLVFSVNATKVIEDTPKSIQINYENGGAKLEFLENDSVFIEYSWADTLFEISNEHILRRYKGQYFLNFKDEENSWKVRCLSIDKDELRFSKAMMPEDVKEVQKITAVKEIKSDSGKIIKYRLNPSKKELKSLMKNHFHETEKYRKIE